MDSKAERLVRDWYYRYDVSLGRMQEAEPEEYDVFIVWKCKTIQNWKYIISTTRRDSRIFELTYNGDRGEWYVDVYKKEDKVIVPQMR